MISLGDRTSTTAAVSCIFDSTYNRRHIPLMTVRQSHDMGYLRRASDGRDNGTMYYGKKIIVVWATDEKLSAISYLSFKADTYTTYRR